MLDVIADFWKPVKKSQPQEILQPELLQIGSSLGFGFVPQAILSGRRLHVNAINTYVFGDEALTSFVLTQDKDPGVSMIVAESEGEYYLAISRRISLNDRGKLFDNEELENVMTESDALRLTCRDNITDFKGWVVASYKREIQGLKGSLFKGDYRKAPKPAASEGQEFEYTLLVSDSNEHAIEIEKYSDGRSEVYATVYRRLGDIGEITHPAGANANASAEMTRPDIKLGSPTQTAAKDPAPAPVMSTNAKLPEAAPQPAAEPARTTPIKLQEFTAAPAPASSPQMSAPKTDESISVPVQTALKAAGIIPTTVQEERPSMTTTETAINGTRNDMSTADAMKPKLYVQPSTPENYARQEIKAVTNKNTFESDAIECDLRVANKIIDEAIRNEMRLTDIVRRIIELPVAFPESVQIPITLTDEDYALLAIRYGIAASDRNAIKRRILEDLNDFSGGKKKAA